MEAVLDVVMDVFLRIFAEKGNRKINSKTLSTFQKNILRSSIVVVSILIILALGFILAKIQASLFSS